MNKLFSIKDLNTVVITFKHEVIFRYRKINVCLFYSIYNDEMLLSILKNGATGIDNHFSSNQTHYRAFQ